MSKKHHNRQDAVNRMDIGKPQQPSSVTWDDLKDDTPKRRIGPPIPEVERQPFTRALAELILIFAIFFIYGAWPVPDTNEPYYVGKAMHAWQPELLKNDVFLNSYDTHWLFYKTFGWLTLYMGLDVATWVGRSVLWLALALGWYRLSRVVVTIPWASVVSALVFACFMVKFQMAGEWIIGGIEGKVFAYVFVFLGLDALARNRWNLMWVLFGMAAAYHPVVGGWAVVAGGMAWLLQRRTDRMPLKRMILPLLIGGAISLVGVVPCILMDRALGSAESREQRAEWPESEVQPSETQNPESEAGNPEPENQKSEAQHIKEQANYIAVFKRLPHHLLPYRFYTSWTIRLSLLTMAWLFCAAVVWGRKTIRPDDPQAVPDNEPIIQPPAPPGFRIACFVVGTIMISCVGFIIAYGLRVPIEDESQLPPQVILAAKLLKYYWFRMTDFTIPLGMALCGTAILYRAIALCRKTQYPAETHWWIKSLGGSALMAGVVYGLAFLYFTNFCPPMRTGLSYDNCTSESNTLAYGVVLIFCGFLLFWNRNHSSQPDRPPSWSMLQLMLSLLIVFGASVPMLLEHSQKRLFPTIPRTVLPSSSPNIFPTWLAMCEWIAENTEEDAIFLVPQRDESFKWYAKRANVSTRKEMPQDAASLVKWYETMNDCYSLNLDHVPDDLRERYSSRQERLLLEQILQTKSQDELIALQEKYRFTYILSEKSSQSPLLKLEPVFETEFYILYRADAQSLNPQSPPLSPVRLPEATVPATIPSMTEPLLLQPFSGSQTPQMAVPQFTRGN